MLVSFYQRKKSLIKYNGVGGNSEYHCLVRKIPMVGTNNTKGWYSEYQRLVLLVPVFGIHCTKQRY